MFFFVRMIGITIMQAIKIILATLLSAFTLAVLLTLNTGEPVMDIIFYSNTEAIGILHGVLENYVGKLPFAGYILDLVGINSNFSLHDGYEVLHEFIKMGFLFLTTHWVFLGLGKYIQIWKMKENVENAFEMAMVAVGNVFLLMAMAFFNTVFTLLLHDWFHEIWINAFGNGSLSNWGMFAAVIGLFVCVYFLIPVISRKNFVHELTSVLIDFGLILCCIVLAYCINPMISFGDMVGTGGEGMWGLYLTVGFAIVGGLVLLRLKVRG